MQHTFNGRRCLPCLGPCVWPAPPGPDGRDLTDAYFDAPAEWEGCACPECGGTGFVESDEWGGFVPCDECVGTGHACANAV